MQLTHEDAGHWDVIAPTDDTFEQVTREEAEPRKLNINTDEGGFGIAQTNQILDREASHNTPCDFQDRLTATDNFQYHTGRDDEASSINLGACGMEGDHTIRGLHRKILYNIPADVQVLLDYNIRHGSRIYIAQDRLKEARSKVMDKAAIKSDELRQLRSDHPQFFAEPTGNQDCRKVKLPPVKVVPTKAEKAERLVVTRQEHKLRQQIKGCEILKDIWGEALETLEQQLSFCTLVNDIGSMLPYQKLNPKDYSTLRATYGECDTHTVALADVEAVLIQLPEDFKELKQSMRYL